ncbi:hypothetical protein LJR219_004842 [Phenylobacterium sp. LjRoot219]|uniref:PKD domain-containing protein n=1 Tax=Phenylobacterium sp. LjRoot219 TaxID=3342283 RepID=UPI003ECD8B26
MLTRRKSLFLFGVSALAFAGPEAALAQAAKALAPTGGVDPVFNEPYVDVDEWRSEPVRHRYVHGGFKGTDARFVFHFPEKAQYQGRFFHYVSPVPVPETEVLHGFVGSIVPFCIDSGAYAVGTNQGGAGATARPGEPIDPTIAAYRVSAAAANYSRRLAAEIYGPHRSYGYVYGGSGGAFRTIGGFENTDAWDGAVPFVMGTPMHIPNVFTVRAYATRILRNKIDQIVDALEPGGSGDMYAGLDAEERAALLEATRMGLPPRAWWFEQQGYMGLGAFTHLFRSVKRADPSYFTDFWTVPGYLGADPPPSLARDRVQHTTKVARVVMSDQAAAAGLPVTEYGPQVDADTAWRSLERQMGGVVPVALELQEPPAGGDLRLAAITIKSGAAAGKELQLNGMHGRFAKLGVSPLSGAPSAAGSLKPGDEVLIDNSDFLAAQTFHRHQVPDPDYHAWDQFRRPDGTPIYPQRPRLIAPSFNKSAAGVLPSAKFKGKMIVVECLIDFDAFPWAADWYRQKVRENLGPNYEDQFRVWFVDHAVHGDPPVSSTHAVAYTPVLQQALRDVSAWVEKGVPAPATTSYKLVDSQIVVPPTAAERKGVQPVLALKANGGVRAEVRAGEPITFEAVVEAPPRTGKIVSAEWDFEGAATFPLKAQVNPAERVTLKTTYVFAKPGTYFPTLRVTSQRQGDAATPFARIPSLQRVRVVVS